MEKKIALIVGCTIAYIVLFLLTGGVFRIVLILGLLGYGMYKFG